MSSSRRSRCSMGAAKTRRARPVTGFTLAPATCGRADKASCTPAARRASLVTAGSATRRRWGVTERATSRAALRSAEGGLTQPTDEIDEAERGEAGAEAEQELAQDAMRCGHARHS